jgi:hypothetical protein
MNKKRILTLLGIVCLFFGHAQFDDAYNSKKYWKFRNNQRQNFIKIGADRGEGINAATRTPLSCKNNLPGGSGALGTMRWADGMIFHGHYIGMLALEYRMLRDEGENYRPTLNELYYAINAINRIDFNAEPIVTTIFGNGLPVAKEPSLNGFLFETTPINF